MLMLIKALGQCSKYLDKNYPHSKRIETESTAEAARMAKETGESAICSSLCANIYCLFIVGDGIEDMQGNTTRFIVAGKNMHVKTGNDLSLLSIMPKNSIGAVVYVFEHAGFNVLKIDSRPSGIAPWYLFTDLGKHYISLGCKDM